MPNWLPEIVPSADFDQNRDWAPSNNIGRGPVPQSKYPHPPRDFNVVIGPDGISLLYTLKEVLRTDAYAYTTGYRFYFAPMTQVSQATIAATNGSNAAFASSARLMGSASSTAINGEVVSWRDTQNYNIDGWFWCTAINKDGIESYPTLAVRAPVGRAGTGCPDAIPVVVTAQAITLTPATFEHQSVVNVFASAIIPIVAVSPTFAGYQLYLDNYFQAGVGTLWQGPSIFHTSTQAGGAISFNFLLYPDAPPNHQVIFRFVAISNCGVRTAAPGLAPGVVFPNGIQ